MIQINQGVLRRRERHFLRDRGLLESACDKPKNLWHYKNEDDVVALATCLMFGLARNHPFEQGNKRTATTAMIGFLGANGFRLHMRDDVEYAKTVVAVLAGKETEEVFMRRLRRVLEREDPRGWT